jgi:hypothetical protein
MRDARMYSAGGGITAPLWANGWGRWITAEFTSSRREMDQRFAQVSHQMEDHEERLRKLESCKRGKFLNLNPLDYIKIGFGLAILLLALAKRIGWDQALPMLGRVLG